MPEPVLKVRGVAGDGAVRDVAYKRLSHNAGDNHFVKFNCAVSRFPCHFLFTYKLRLTVFLRKELIERVERPSIIPSFFFSLLATFVCTSLSDASKINVTVYKLLAIFTFSILAFPHRSLYFCGAIKCALPFWAATTCPGFIPHSVLP